MYDEKKKRFAKQWWQVGDINLRVRLVCCRCCCRRYCCRSKDRGDVRCCKRQTGNKETGKGDKRGVDGWVGEKWTAAIVWTDEGVYGNIGEILSQQKKSLYTEWNTSDKKKRSWYFYLTNSLPLDNCNWCIFVSPFLFLYQIIKANFCCLPTNYRRLKIMRMKWHEKIGKLVK